MAVALPVNLGAVADVAEKYSAGRYSMNGVELVLTARTDLVYPTGPKGVEVAGPPVARERYAYRASATDTKRLVVVEGDAGAADDLPGLDAVRTAPNGATRALIPAREFKKTFADADKATRAFRRRPECRQVLVSLSEQVATLGYTGLDAERVQQTQLVEGTFPPVESVLKSARKAAPAVTFAVDPKYMAELMKLAAGYCDPETMRVEVEVRGADKPLVMTVTNPAQKVTILLMPLSD